MTGAAVMRKDLHSHHSLNISALPFHVLHTGGEENISLDAIQTQVDVLNKGFQGTEFSFYLALVTRTHDEAWVKLADEGVPSVEIRNALLIDPDHVINVFIGDMQNNAIGWSVFTDTPDSTEPCHCTGLCSSSGRSV